MQSNITTQRPTFFFVTDHAQTIPQYSSRFHFNSPKIDIKNLPSPQCQGVEHLRRRAGLATPGWPLRQFQFASFTIVTEGPFLSRLPILFFPFYRVGNTLLPSSTLPRPYYLPPSPSLPFTFSLSPFQRILSNLTVKVSNTSFSFSRVSSLQRDKR